MGVVAVAAVDLVHLATELFVHQGHSAPVAEEAGLVPVLILVRQILQTIRRQLSFARSRLTEVIIVFVSCNEQATDRLRNENTRMGNEKQDLANYTLDERRKTSIIFDAAAFAIIRNSL